MNKHLVFTPFSKVSVAVYSKAAKGAVGEEVVVDAALSRPTGGRRRPAMLKNIKPPRAAIKTNLTTDDDAGRARCERVAAGPRAGNATARFVGSRAINRAAIVPASDGAQSPFGRLAMIEVKRCVAASFDCCASSADSCQGSISSRASAESTVRTAWLPSSPMGANRKSLNSDFSSENAGGSVASSPRIGHVSAR